MQIHKLTIILKARQLGLTWLCLAYAIWQIIFRPQAEVLLFSRRDDEAVHLLDERLKGMYNRLPAWMRARDIVRSNSHEFSLSNGSTARAFPTSADDSYTATLAIVDEADLVPDFNRLMRAVKPTIDTGGRMILLSRTDKTKPQSEFKRIYRAAKTGDSSSTPIFLPWHVHFSPDGRLLASAGYDPIIPLWDVASGRCVHEIEQPGGCHTTSFHPTGSVLATANFDHTITLWDVQSWQRLAILHCHTGEMWAMTF